ncbi:MAG: ABC transporter ATP-binding protein [Candidatus Nitrospinota bacterium M3_3B_026]
MKKEAPELLKVEGLKREFFIDHRRIVVLDGIDLSVSRGETLGIVGASGAGKSTFLSVVGALDRPTSGRVHHNGVDIFAMNERKLASFRAKRIGFVFQAHYLMPEFNAEENVALAAMIAGAKRAEAMDRARFFLGRVGLSERLSHRPGKLSGGEQQRVAIARALVNEPDLILADEPTGNLDTKTGDEVFDLLLDLNRERGQTSLIVTHNPSLVKRLSRVVRIRDGKFVDSRDDVLE